MVDSIPLKNVSGQSYKAMIRFFGSYLVVENIMENWAFAFAYCQKY